MKHWKTILGIFFGFTIFGLFLPFLITQKSWFSDLYLGRADANEIGDTIGGILGPYFSFIGSLLLAYTIYLQIEQRKEEKQKEYEKTIFEEVNKEFNSIIDLIESYGTNNDPNSIDFQTIARESFEIEVEKTLEHTKFKEIFKRIYDNLIFYVKSIPSDYAYISIIHSKINRIEFLFGPNGHVALIANPSHIENFINQLQKTNKDFTVRLCYYYYSSSVFLCKKVLEQHANNQKGLKTELKKRIDAMNILKDNFPILNEIIS